jgi:16S rRNA (guanine527-N7)-methyltransferase
VVLLDSNERRTDFLLRAVEGLHRTQPARVVRARAEEAGRDPGLRSAFDVAVARSFGPPAVTAECVSPFLSVGGRLVVSEPPDRNDRWPVDGLVKLGLDQPRPFVTPAGRFQVLRQGIACPAGYPRRVGKPTKRPLF